MRGRELIMATATSPEGRGDGSSGKQERNSIGIPNAKRRRLVGPETGKSMEFLRKFASIDMDVLSTEQAAAQVKTLVASLAT